ncbi:hypothetical protein AXA59_16760 [Enterobacter hormaechei]|nr:hypothetical protein AM409_20270 [Enterobacter cloacae complex sp.]AWS77088.1 hypothetical protein AM401_00850 [Enterobacter cloacae complex sp.]AXO46266.1 hypothetical protein AXA59_16760 [Enterobacter hormaechei]
MPFIQFGETVCDVLADCRSNFHLFTGNVHCHKFYLLSFRLGDSSIPDLMSKCVIWITLFCRFLSGNLFCEAGQEEVRFTLSKPTIAVIVEWMC